MRLTFLAPWKKLLLINLIKTYETKKMQVLHLDKYKDNIICIFGSNKRDHSFIIRVWQKKGHVIDSLADRTLSILFIKVKIKTWPMSNTLKSNKCTVRWPSYVWWYIWEYLRVQVFCIHCFFLLAPTCDIGLWETLQFWTLYNVRVMPSLKFS